MTVKLAVVKTGEQIITDVEEMTLEDKVVGYRLIYPFTLALGEPNDDGTIPIEYTRFCPFSPQEEHRLSGEHIISVVFPDNGILDNYASKLRELGVAEETIFPPEVTDGDNSEPAEAGE